MVYEMNVNFPTRAQWTNKQEKNVLIISHVFIITVLDRNRYPG